MNLQGKNVYLRDCNESDILSLFEWRNNYEFRKNCSVRKDEILLSDFKKELKEDFKRDRHIQMMIIRKNNDKSIGTIYSYGYKKIDGHVFVTIFLSEGYCDKGYGAEAVILFLFRLFNEFPLFKVYMEVYEYNSKSSSCIQGAGFSKEGRLIGHRVLNDARYDLIRYAVYRECDFSRIEKFLKRLRRSV